MGKRAERVLVIGLDSATPQFVFGPNRFDLPNLQRLAESGCWCPLQSCHPPITIPAWAVMTSGKDPGTLGIYGFRNRADHSYDAMFTANSNSITEPRVWDILSRAGRKVVVLGVPQTHPVRPVNGWLAAGFPMPDHASEYTYPKTLKSELEKAVGEYIIDVKDFRTEDKAGLIGRIHALMENRFAAARFLMETKPWDFFMMVEMGMDRVHHGFWRYADPAHPLHEPGNAYLRVIREFYEAVDRRIGEILAIAGEGTAVIVVSDHGAKAMHGGICVNQWLINEGLLAVRDSLGTRKRIEDCSIDWSRTRVWSSGGYYARMFFNVADREPHGIIPAREYETFRDEIIARLEAMKGPDGKPLGNKAYRPQDLYRVVKGVAPDLIVYFADLAWRSVGTVGFESIYTFENDTGPDDANHDHFGIFIMGGAAGQQTGRLERAQLMDVAPTVLDILGVDVPLDMQGSVVG